MLLNLVFFPQIFVLSAPFKFIQFFLNNQIFYSISASKRNLIIMSWYYIILLT